MPLALQRRLPKDILALGACGVVLTKAKPGSELTKTLFPGGTKPVGPPAWTRTRPREWPAFLFEGAYYWGTTNGLLVSKDKGASWQPQGAAVNVWQGPFFGRDEKDIIVVGKDGVFISKNAGETWTRAAGLKSKEGGFVFTPNWFGCYARDPVNRFLYASAMGNPVFGSELEIAQKKVLPDTGHRVPPFSSD
jgi:hypothetical protein